MTIPFYVAPEQIMKDRAEYAQKGIARGRSLIATVYSGGILIIGENPSRSLHKISEIYDRIAFAGVGKYNEFDQLRVAGIRHADVRGYTYSRNDVDGRSLANLYAQYLGQVFTHEMKPLEVEILVAELRSNGGSQLYHISYDGTVADEDRFVVLGGESAGITERFKSRFRSDWKLNDAFIACLESLIEPNRQITANEIEAAVLDKNKKPRSFRRIENSELEELVSQWQQVRETNQKDQSESEQDRKTDS